MAVKGKSVLITGYYLYLHISEDILTLIDAPEESEKRSLLNFTLEVRILLINSVTQAEKT